MEKQGQALLHCKSDLHQWNMGIVAYVHEHLSESYLLLFFYIIVIF